MTVRLLYESRTQCRSIRVGQYGEFDGEKVYEHLFEAHNATFSNPNRRRAR